MTIALASCLAILWGHASLPGTAAFAALLVPVLAATVLLSCRVERTGAAAGRRTPPAGRTETPSIEATLATLRALEAELHALGDQCATAKAASGGRA